MNTQKVGLLPQVPMPWEQRRVIRTKLDLSEYLQPELSFRILEHNITLIILLLEKRDWVRYQNKRSYKNQTMQGSGDTGQVNDGVSLCVQECDC